MLITRLHVHVDKWGPDGVEGNGHVRGDDFPGMFSGVDELNAELLFRGLPKIEEWDAWEMENEVGRYDWDRIEDDDGQPKEDDPKAETGQWLVTYSLYIEVCEPQPWVRDAKEE